MILALVEVARNIKNVVAAIYKKITEKRDMMLEEYKSEVENIRQQLSELRDSL